MYKTNPSDWQVVQLGDVANIDFSSVDKKIRKDEISIKLCNYQDVINFQYIRSDIDFSVATASTKEYEKWILYKGDVIFTKDAEIGKISIVEENIPDLLLGYHLGRARPKTKLISSHFLAISLQTSDAQSQFRRLKTGVTISGIRLGDCRSIRLPLPTISEQELIVSILKSVDNILEQTNDVIEKQRQLQDSLLNELLTRGLPGCHNKWKLVSLLGIIPDDWLVLRLGDVCSKPKYGAPLSAQPHDPVLPRYIRITDLTDDGQLHDTDPRSVDPISGKGYELTIGDILFARSGSVGRTYLYKPEDGNCIYAGYLIKFRPNPKIALPEFIELWTRSQPYKRWVSMIARTGAQPNINAKEYSSMPIPLPSLIEQKRLIEIIGSINYSIRLMDQERSAVKQLKRALFHRLFNEQILE